MIEGCLSWGMEARALRGMPLFGEPEILLRTEVYEKPGRSKLGV